jgi:uncharacterized membrane protein YphA (DoxX/SURF4 family)
VNPFAFALPWAEAVLGLLLILGWQTRRASVLSALLMVVFLLAIAINLGRGRRDLECGCFGSRRHEKIGWKVVGRDLILLLLSLQLALWGGGSLALDSQPPAVQQFVLDRVVLTALLPLALSGTGLYLVYRLAGQLGRLIQWIPTEQKR